jgi:hypothetical protein
MSIDAKRIKSTYDKYIALMRKFFPNDHAGIDRLEAELGERLALSPRDTHPEKGGYPGGLINFALTTAKYGGLFKTVVDAKKLARVALLHELGKLGELEEGQELFVPEESDWHREKLGRHYKYNENCPKMSVAHRSMFYISRYCLSVDADEWVALATSAGFQYDENRFYANENLPLAQALHTARTFAFTELSSGK